MSLWERVLRHTSSTHPPTHPFIYTYNLKKKAGLKIELLDSIVGVSSVINMEKTPSLLGKISSILQLCCSWGTLLTALTSAALKESSRKGLLRITLIKYALTTGFPVYPIMNMNNHAILLDSKNNHVLKLFPHCQNPTADFFRDIWSSTVVLSQQVSPICSPPPPQLNNVFRMMYSVCGDTFICWPGKVSLCWL